jgi:nitrogen fixation protein NifX
MSQIALSRDMALRIGLAARALPDTNAQRLLHVLTTELGLPLTEEKLASLNLKTLKAAADGEFSDIEESLLKKAVHTLKHEVKETSETNLPTISPYEEDEMPGSIRIAFASEDGLNVDGHFGSCSQFLIYQVSANLQRLIDIRVSSDTSEFQEDKNFARALMLKDCQVLYIASVGGPAAAKIVKLGIHPIKLKETESIASVLAQLKLVLGGTPPPWLAKVMGIEADQRVRFEREATA